MTYSHTPKLRPLIPTRPTYHYVGCWHQPGHEECRQDQNSVRGEPMATDPEEAPKFVPRDSLEWLVADALIGAGAAVEGAKTTEGREAAQKRVTKYQAILKRFREEGAGE
jgi:hypothetical protein